MVAITIPPMKAGLSNQKLALVGLATECLRLGRPMALPPLVDYRPPASRHAELPFEMVFCARSFAKAPFARPAEYQERHVDASLIGTWPLALHQVGAAFVSAASVIKSGSQPLHPNFPHVRRATRGAVYTMDGDLVPASLRCGGLGGDHVVAVDPAKLNPPVDAPLVQGRTLWLGPFHSHYGHFLTEMLSRAWPAMDCKDYEVFACFPFRGDIEPQTAFMRYMFAQIGVDPDRLMIIKEPTLFSNISIPEQGWIINSHANVALRELYRKIAVPHRGVRAPPHVFLSRGASVQARLVNSAEVEQIFAERGFKVIYPENLSISDQLAIYANAHIIAGLAGSALHNVVFARPDVQIIEVGDPRTPNQPHLMQRIALALAKARGHFIAYQGVAGTIKTDYVADRLDQILSSLDGQPRCGSYR